MEINGQDMQEIKVDDVMVPFDLKFCESELCKCKISPILINVCIIMWNCKEKRFLSLLCPQKSVTSQPQEANPGSWS